MDDILDMLAQEIERSAFPCCFAKSEYRQNQRYALEHFQWLEEHLGEEEKVNFEKARAADLSLDTLDLQAIMRTALALGIRLALCC